MSAGLDLALTLRGELGGVLSLLLGTGRGIREPAPACSGDEVRLERLLRTRSLITWHVWETENRVICVAQSLYERPGGQEPLP